MKFSNLLTITLLLGISEISFGQVDPARGGPVTTMASNPVSFAWVSQQLEYNATATTRYFNDFYTYNAGYLSNIQLVQDPAGSGKNVFRMTVKKTDPLAAGASRTEVSAKFEYVKEGVRWYAMSMYFPTDWVYHWSPTLVAQIHTSQKTLATTPPLSITASGTNLMLGLSSNHRDIVSTTDPATKENTARQDIRLAKLETGKWYCFVIKSDWSHTIGKGSLAIWMNGDQVLDQKNTPNAYETWLGNYPKTGLYLPGTMQITSRTIYQDFTHLGGAASTYTEMFSKTPCAPK